LSLLLFHVYGGEERTMYSSFHFWPEWDYDRFLESRKGRNVMKKQEAAALAKKIIDNSNKYGLPLKKKKKK
jgi:hypothetical protein